MVYSMHNYRHYLLGPHFKLYTNYSSLKYLINKLDLGGIIYRWLLLFQAYDFEVIVNPEKAKVGPDHLMRIESSEQGRSLDDNLPDAYLFRVTMIEEKLEDIAYFLRTGKTPNDYTIVQHNQLMVVKVTDYQLIVGQLYKFGANENLRRCLHPHEREYIMREAHKGVVRGNYARKSTM